MNLMEKIEKIVLLAGQIMLEAKRDASMTESKEGFANFVTVYDKKVQAFLFDELGRLLPEAVFIGEEQEKRESLQEGYAFIIDPIDGTTNFIRDYHASCISVGLFLNREPYIGIVYQPYLHELYSAQKGCGAFLNGKRIHVTDKAISEGLLIFGTSPYYEHLHHAAVCCGGSMLGKALDIRRSGSAAIDLCNIAAGRAECFFELLLSPWDYAAGGLIVTEAGGRIASGFGYPLSYDAPCPVIADNGHFVPDVDYELLTRKLSALYVPDQTARLANQAAAIFREIPMINWAGFYLLKEDGKLHLGPFQGQAACTVIPLGQGVCGWAAAERKSRLVSDVHCFPGHIACDSASASELVVPLLRGDGSLFGLLDLDSPWKGRFTDRDLDGLKKAARIIGKQADLQAASTQGLFQERKTL